MNNPVIVVDATGIIAIAIFGILLILYMVFLILEKLFGEKDDENS